MPVAARFHELRDRVVETVDMKFAEPVRLSFMKNGQTDPGRSQATIEAVLRTGASQNSSMEGGQGRGWRTRLQAGKAELHIDRVKYPNLIPKKGDAVRALSRQGEPAYEVLSVDERNHTRLILALGEK
ncbi:Hypothetical protein NGAL_HAMBI1146_58660 [Neorhizobium galegae bv. officinalis]|nr:Hypothetical protein NGAL_HAMBI1146_58660 [Neorhizobium galegae bv. officinalis]